MTILHLHGLAPELEEADMNFGSPRIIASVPASAEFTLPFVLVAQAPYVDPTVIVWHLFILGYGARARLIGRVIRIEEHTRLLRNSKYR